MINKFVCTLFTWSVHIHIYAVGGLWNSETIFNFCWSLSQHFSSNGQNRILNPCVQCAYIRERRTTVLISFTYLQNKKVHRCHIRWVGRSCCGTASTNPTRASFNENISRNTFVSLELIIPSIEGTNAPYCLWQFI